MHAVRLMVGAAALALGAGAARAEEPDAEPSAPTYVVLLAEAEDPDEAERLREAYTRRAPQALPVGEGFPRVLGASSLPGLPEERHYVVLGFCEEREEAQAALKRVRRAAPQARVAVTTEPVEVSCPGRPVPESPWELQASAWVGRKGPEAKRAWFIHRHRDEPEQCLGANRWRVVVREGERVLAREELAAVCRPPLEGTAEGESSQWRVEPMDLGNATVLYTHHSHQCCGDTAYTHALWAYGCGRLVKQELGIDMERADQGVLEVARREAEGGRPAAVRVTRHDNPTLDEPTLIEEYTWSPRQCRFRSQRVRAAEE